MQAWAQHLETLYPNDPSEWHHLKTASSYTLSYAGPVLYTVNFASIWTITAIAIERHRAICDPFSVVSRQNELR